MSPEQRLWQTVINRELMYATAEHPKGRERQRMKQEADSYLRSGGGDFFTVCALAGYDPHFVREKYIAGKVDGRALRAREETRCAE